MARSISQIVSSATPGVETIGCFGPLDPKMQATPRDDGLVRFSIQKSEFIIYSRVITVLLVQAGTAGLPLGPSSELR